MRNRLLTRLLPRLLVIVGGLCSVRASGPGAAADFALLGAGNVYVQTMQFSGAVGAIGGATVELTDGVQVNGDLIAGASFYGAMELGDRSRIRGKCVSGGGDIVFNHPHPARCHDGTDSSGTDPLLTRLASATTDARQLAADLRRLVPTMSLQELTTAQDSTTAMTLGSGVHVIAISGRMLIGGASRLLLRAPVDATIVFLVSGDFTMHERAHIELTGGVRRDSVAYVVAGSVLLGDNSALFGTVLADSGSCLAYERARIRGAMFCNAGIAISPRVRLNFRPLRTSFP